MLLTEFDYELPNDLIAYFPLEQRTASRLLCLENAGTKWVHRQFVDLVDLLNPHDVLVFNDSKVIPARLYGVKETGGKIELLIERILTNTTALAHIRANKSVKQDTLIACEKGYKVKVTGRQDDLYVVEFLSPLSILTILDEIGHIPLPSYIEREDQLLDRFRYQTVYSRIQGSVAAPTAGLHFDEKLLQTIQQKNIDTAFVTLHVGAGTFQPVRTDNITDHVMHSEYVEVSAEAVEKILQAKALGGRVIAVGTTSVRCLETASKTGILQPFYGETNLFIYPGYQFHLVDAMVTNFHAPKSSLLMLVSAFAGVDNIKNAYQQAILHRYRFFSYGDAMFITGALNGI